MFTRPELILSSKKDSMDIKYKNVLYLLYNIMSPAITNVNHTAAFEMTNESKI